MDEQQINLELRRINDSIPACYKKGLLKESLVAPTVKKVIEAAIKSKSISLEKREAYKNLLATGDLDTKTLVESPKQAERINKWVEKEIQKSIKAGRLPPREEIENMQFIKDLKQKYEDQKAKAN